MVVGGGLTEKTRRDSFRFVAAAELCRVFRLGGGKIFIDFPWVLLGNGGILSRRVCCATRGWCVKHLQPKRGKSVPTPGAMKTRTHARVFLLCYVHCSLLLNVDTAGE